MTGTRPWTAPLLLSAAIWMLVASGCAGTVGGGELDDLSITTDDAGQVAPADLADATLGPADDAPPPVVDPPEAYAPCQVGQCWAAPTLSGSCGHVKINEDFSSGKYNVHEFPLTTPADVAVTLTLKRTAGSWSPALIVRDEAGTIVHDGERSAGGDALTVKLVASGKASSSAAVGITANRDTQLYVFVTAWGVVDSDFFQTMPLDAEYQLDAFADCVPPPPGPLLSPPNFDPSDTKDGYYLLPQSDPPGLYVRKADYYSRGTKLLIDVIYTVATHWKQQRPALSPLAVRDLNNAPDHATHDDGTHVDIVADCATSVACTDDQPAIELAKLFIDTGQACGIINNNTAAQAVVNAYFTAKYSYEPWHGTFMRSLAGHTGHFHVRVKKPDGSCN